MSPLLGGTCVASASKSPGALKQCLAVVQAVPTYTRGANSHCGRGEGFSAVSLVMRREHVAVAARPCRFLSPRAVLSRVNFFLVRSMRQRLFLIFSATPARFCSDSKVVHKEETHNSRPLLSRFVFLCGVTRPSHNGCCLARPAVVSKTLYANHSARYIFLPSRLCLLRKILCRRCHCIIN